MRILIVKTSSMGDVVHALPVASDIARALPHAQVDWLCEEAFAAIPALSAHVHEVRAVALRRWRRRPLNPSVWHEVRVAKRALRQARYDVVLDVQGLAKSAWLARWTGAPVTGFDSDAAREPLAAHFYQHRFHVPHALHAVERCRRLAALTLGYALVDAARFDIARSVVPPPDGPAPPAVLLVNASRATKRWDAASWLAVEQWLAEHGMESLLFWGSDNERRLTEALVARMRRARIAPRTTLQDVALTLAAAPVVVGLDTGLTHLAAALGRPTVGIFRDYDPALTGVTADGGAGNAVANVGSATVAPTAAEVIDAVARVTGLDR